MENNTGINGQGNAGDNNQQNNGTGERTFTQEELNSIVQKRVNEVSKKYENYEELKEKAQKFDAIEEESKSELDKQKERADALQKELDGMKKADSIRAMRAEVSKEKGVPEHLLTADTKEACEAQAKDILDFKKSGTYPNVKDKGEVTPPSGKKSTREQFAEWVEKTTQGGE